MSETKIIKKFCDECGESVIPESVEYADHLPDFNELSIRQKTGDSYLKNSVICAECFEERYFTCNDCGKSKSKEEARQLNGGGAVCDDCAVNYQSCDECYYYFVTEFLIRICPGCTQNLLRMQNKLQK